MAYVSYRMQSACVKCMTVTFSSIFRRLAVLSCDSSSWYLNEAKFDILDAVFSKSLSLVHGELFCSTQDKSVEP